MKLLTVTIPCYNSQDYMEKCIQSLLPGGERIEIIIINDGSKDRTGEIADAFAEKYRHKNAEALLWDFYHPDRDHYAL